MLAKHVFYQLNYTPLVFVRQARIVTSNELLLLAPICCPGSCAKHHVLATLTVGSKANVLCFKQGRSTGCKKNHGRKGIRTHGTIYLYADLANQCLRPLSHPSLFLQSTGLTLPACDGTLTFSTFCTPLLIADLA